MDSQGTEWHKTNIKQFRAKYFFVWRKSCWTWRVKNELSHTVQILCLCVWRKSLLHIVQQLSSYILSLSAWKTTNREQPTAAHFLAYWGPWTVNASLRTSSETVILPRKLQQLWWNRIYPYMVDPLGLTQWNDDGFQSNNETDEDTTPELCKCNWEKNFAQKFYVLCFGVVCSFLYVLFLNCRWMLFCQKINEIQRWLQTFAGAMLTLKIKKHQVTFLVWS